MTVKIFVKYTCEKIDTHEKFNKIYSWKCKSIITNISQKILENAQSRPIKFERWTKMQVSVFSFIFTFSFFFVTFKVQIIAGKIAISPRKWTGSSRNWKLKKFSLGISCAGGLWSAADDMLREKTQVFYVFEEP